MVSFRHSEDCHGGTKLTCGKAHTETIAGMPKFVFNVLPPTMRGSEDWPVLSRRHNQSHPHNKTILALQDILIQSAYFLVSPAISELRGSNPPQGIALSHHVLAALLCLLSILLVL